MHWEDQRWGSLGFKFFDCDLKCPSWRKRQILSNVGQPLLNDYFFSKVETLKNIWFEMPKILKFLIEGSYFHCLENPLQMPQKHFLVHQLNLNCFEHIVLWGRDFAKIFFSWGARREQEEWVRPKSCNSQGDKLKRDVILQQADAVEI